MSVYRLVFYPILLLSVAVGCAMKDKETDSPNQGSMSEISHLYADLVPYIYSSEAFQDPKNKLFIKTRMDQLNYRVIQMQKPYLERPMDSDPVVIMGLNNIRNSLQEGLGSFYVQSFSYAQKQLRQSFEDFIKLTAFFKEDEIQTDNWAQVINETQTNLGQGELANLQMAVQRYPKAIEALLIHLQVDALSPDEQIEVIKRLMVISIKNMQEPSLALAVVKDLKMDPRFSAHKDILNQWSSYLKETVKRPRAFVLSEVYENNMKVTGTFVEILDKATVLHNSLPSVIEKGKRASILYSLGQLYGKNQDLGFKNMSTIYYERCIKEYPYSRLSERCYFSLEEEIREQHGLSLADRLPKAEKYHLIELRYLTRPMITQKNPKVGISNYVDY